MFQPLCTLVPFGSVPPSQIPEIECLTRLSRLNRRGYNFRQSSKITVAFRTRYGAERNGNGARFVNESPVLGVKGMTRRGARSTGPACNFQLGNRAARVKKRKKKKKIVIMASALSLSTFPSSLILPLPEGESPMFVI